MTTRQYSDHRNFLTWQTPWLRDRCMRREPDVYTILSQLEIGHFMLVLQSLNEFSDGQIFTTVCLFSILILRCVMGYVPLL